MDDGGFELACRHMERWQLETGCMQIMAGRGAKGWRSPARGCHSVRSRRDKQPPSAYRPIIDHPSASSMYPPARVSHPRTDTRLALALPTPHSPGAGCWASIKPHHDPLTAHARPYSPTRRPMQTMQLPPPCQTSACPQAPTRASFANLFPPQLHAGWSLL